MRTMTTPALIMACDFFIFLSSSAAAGGRGMVVAMSAICFSGIDLDSFRLRLGKQNSDVAMDIPAR